MVKATLAKEVNNTIEYIYPKTSADLVEYSSSQTVEQKIQSIDSTISTMDARITNLSSTTVSGNVATDATLEVTDIRLGADGTTYASAGESVRSQITQLSNDMDFLSDNYVDMNVKVNNLSNDLENDIKNLHPSDTLNILHSDTITFYKEGSNNQSFNIFTNLKIKYGSYVLLKLNIDTPEDLTGPIQILLNNKKYCNTFSDVYHHKNTFIKYKLISNYFSEEPEYISDIWILLSNTNYINNDISISVDFIYNYYDIHEYFLQKYFNFNTFAYIVEDGKCIVTNKQNYDLTIRFTENIRYLPYSIYSNYDITNKKYDTEQTVSCKNIDININNFEMLFIDTTNNTLVVKQTAFVNFVIMENNLVLLLYNHYGNLKGLFEKYIMYSDIDNRINTLYSNVNASINNYTEEFYEFSNEKEYYDVNNIKYGTNIIDGLHNLKVGDKIRVFIGCDKNLPFINSGAIQLVTQPGKKFINSFDNDKINTYIDFEIGNQYLNGVTDITGVGLNISGDYLYEGCNFWLKIKYGRSLELDHEYINNWITRIDNKLPFKYFENNYIQQKIDQYNINNRYLNGISFVYFTDPHYNRNALNSKYIIKYVLDNTNAQFCLCGGDAVFAYGTEDDIHFAGKSIIDYSNYIGRDRFFTARGNHDFTIKFSQELTNDTGNGITLQDDINYTYLVKNLEMCKNVNLVKNKCYYSIDIPNQNTRIYILDSMGSQSSDINQPWGDQRSLGQDQIDWLINDLTSINNTKCIFISHIPFNSNIRSYDTNQYPFKHIFEALKNKTSADFSNQHVTVNCDFTETTNEFICWIGGHNHKDVSHRENGVLSITSACDLNSAEAGWKGIRYKGTIIEQAVDLFTINFDNNSIKAIRIGYGEDREWLINSNDSGDDGTGRTLAEMNN